MKINVITLILIVALLPLQIMAQQNFTAKGKVTILNSLPLQNITISSAKTGQTTTTRLDGSFDITSCDKDVLVISQEPFFESKTKIKVSKKNGIEEQEIVLNFIRKKQVLREILERGYLDYSFKDEAIMNLKIEKDYGRYGDVATCLQLEFPSLQLNGDCLCNPTSGSLNNECMLVIIDNKEASSVNEIQLSAVEKMYILKANDAAIYGVKAKNDVFVVKYKGGIDMNLDTDD